MEENTTGFNDRAATKLGHEAALSNNCSDTRPEKNPANLLIEHPDIKADVNETIISTDRNDTKPNENDKSKIITVNNVESKIETNKTQLNYVHETNDKDNKATGSKDRNETTPYDNEKPQLKSIIDTISMKLSKFKQLKAKSFPFVKNRFSGIRENNPVQSEQPVSKKSCTDNEAEILLNLESLESCAFPSAHSQNGSKNLMDVDLDINKSIFSSKGPFKEIKEKKNETSKSLLEKNTVEKTSDTLLSADSIRKVPIKGILLKKTTETNIEIGTPNIPSDDRTLSKYFVESMYPSRTASKVNGSQKSLLVKATELFNKNVVTSFSLSSFKNKSSHGSTKEIKQENIASPKTETKASSNKPSLETSTVNETGLDTAIKQQQSDKVIIVASVHSDVKTNQKDKEPGRQLQSSNHENELSKSNDSIVSVCNEPAIYKSVSFNTEKTHYNETSPNPAVSVMKHVPKVKDNNKPKTCDSKVKKNDKPADSSCIQANPCTPSEKPTDSSCIQANPCTPSEKPADSSCIKANACTSSEKPADTSCTSSKDSKGSDISKSYHSETCPNRAVAVLKDITQQICRYMSKLVEDNACLNPSCFCRISQSCSCLTDKDSRRGICDLLRSCNSEYLRRDGERCINIQMLKQKTDNCVEFLNELSEQMSRARTFAHF